MDVTVGQLLDLLRQNLNLTLTIINEEGDQIITFNSSGSIAIDSWVNLKYVDHIGIESAEHFNIYVKTS